MALHLALQVTSGGSRQPGSNKLCGYDLHPFRGLVLSMRARSKSGDEWNGGTLVGGHGE